MIKYFYFKDVDYQTLINGYDFGANNPPFTTVGAKHYISEDNWALWVSSKPNADYVLNTFPVFSALEEFAADKFEELTPVQYEAHKTDLSSDHAAYIDKEWQLCELVLKEMGTELQRQISEGELGQVQALQIQELFSKQVPLAFAALGGLELSIPVTEYLGQNRSLGAARLRLSATPINVGIGFTQTLKDHFLAVIDKEISALDA